MRVLVVDDVGRLADDIAEGLRDQGIGADVAYDGQETAFKLDVYPYDVVLLDRDLPGAPRRCPVRGEMTTKREKPVMVLMLTASGAPGDRVSGLALGADDHLAKPLHFPELVLRLRALARRAPAPEPRILRVGGIELDPRARSATRDGRLLDLSVKEMAVPEALMQASRAYLSAEDLLERVREEMADPLTKTVQVTIGRLRRKLGVPAVIETSQRAGYRIA